MQTLQSFCLNRIATSFDRYHYVYSTTKNEDLQGALLFLQRFYSHELVTRLNRGYRLKEKHADFIFNKFLKYMDTDWLTNFSWDGIVNIFERIGPNLESVRFRRLNSRRYRPWKDVVRHLSELKILKCLFCNDGMLRSAAMYCPKLEKLDIQGVGVTDSGLKYFCGNGKKRKRGARRGKVSVPCPSLREISAIDTSVEGEAIEQLLKRLRSLERLDYENLPRVLHKMHKRDLLSLDNVQRYNLNKLDLSDCVGFVHTEYYDEMLRISVTLCPKLQSLTCFVVNLEHLTLISQLSDLKSLELTAKNENLDVSELLKQTGEKLTTLELRGCIVSLSALKQCCRSLVYLRLDYVSIRSSGDDSSDVFSHLKLFRCLDLVDCKALSSILASSPVLGVVFFAYRYPLDFETMKSGILECFEQTVAHTVGFLNDTDVKAEFLKEVLLTCPTIKKLVFCARHGLREVRRFAKTLMGRPRIKIRMVNMSRFKTEVDP